MAKLRLTYAYRDKADLNGELNEKAKRELELTKILGDLRAEHAQLLDPDSKMKKKKKRTADVVANEIKNYEFELQEINNLGKNGWILIDFPTNFS